MECSEPIMCFYNKSPKTGGGGRYATLIFSRGHSLRVISSLLLNDISITFLIWMSVEARAAVYHTTSSSLSISRALIVF